MNQRAGFVRYNAYTFFWALLIAVLVLLPGQNLPKLSESIFSIDKLVHAFLFAGLAFLMIVGFSKQSAYPLLRNKALPYAFILSISYAILVEGLQLLSLDRMFEMLDMVANIGGVLAGFLLFFALYKW